MKLNLFKSLFTLSTLLIPLFQGAMTHASDRLDELDNQTSLTQVMNSKNYGLNGIRYLRPVLPGLLYRGGGPGGKVELNHSTLQSLCESGFSTAIYLYPEGFSGTKHVACSSQKHSQQSLSYEQTGFRGNSDRYQALKMIRDAAINNSGPVFVHCWNGWHASGELSAIALIQFCGWEGEEAANYWKSNIGDQGNVGKYGKIMHTYIAGFTPFNDLKLPEELKRKYCPAR